MQISSDFSNSNYIVEGHYYPQCILGGDRFCDWFSVKPPPIQLTTKYTLKMMLISFELGIRGFDISLRNNLVNAFKCLKNKHPDAIGIGNPNWLCGYKLENVNLMEIKDRLLLTIFQRLNEREINLLSRIPRQYRFERFLVKRGTKPLTDEEIKNIYIDKQIWLDRISGLRGLTDFCLIGADYADWMCMLKRIDLLRWQIETVRKNEMIPISVSHWTSLTIPLLDMEAFGAHWILANRAWIYLDFESASNSIKNAVKPITAFKILKGINLPEGIESTIVWLKNLGVKSVVIGVETPEQAKITIPKVIKAISIN